MSKKKKSGRYSLAYELGSKDYLYLNLLEAFERTLRLYDFRGDSRYFSKEYIRRLGRALGSGLEEGQFLAVSGDNRESTETLKKTLIKAVNETGVHVLDLGMAPTPVTYLANYLLDDPAVAGSVMITASHCEKHENGLKLVLGKKPLYGDRLKELALAALTGRFHAASRPGQKRLFNINPEYNRLLRRRIDSVRDRLDRQLLSMIVVDGGHGLIGPRAVKVYERDLGLYMHKLYCSPDRTFSAHSPDPTRKRNMVNLASTVAAYHEPAVLGLAFDGDGDRLGVVDSRGRIYFGPELTAMFLLKLVRTFDETRLVADTQLPLAVIRWISQNLTKGLCIIREPGNPQFKETMLAEKLHFGGETSGHFFFTPLDPNGAFRQVGVDDALLASLHLVEFILEAGKPFHELAEELLAEIHDGSVTVWSKRFALPEEHRVAVLDQVRSRFQTRLPDLGPRIRLQCTESIKNISSGMKEALTIRPSQTEAVLKVQWEGPPKKRRPAKTGLKRDLVRCYREAGAPIPPELG